MTKQFFNQTNCDRCKGSLEVRTMSWFTGETICMDCSCKELDLRHDMKELGYDPDKFEGCGQELYTNMVAYVEKGMSETVVV